MDKIEQLKGEVWMIWQIFIVCNECYDYTCYFHKPDTKEEQDYLEKSKDFRFIRQILWRMTIIELSKLVSSSSKRDRYNLFNLIKKLQKNGYYSNLTVNEETVQKWETKLFEQQELIEKILLLRDKLYAHTDSGKNKYTGLVIKFTEIKELLFIVEDVIKELYHQVFNAEAHIDNLFFDRNQFNIIKILNEEKQGRINELIRRINEK